MTIWCWVEPGEDGVTPVVLEMTDEEILARFYPWWSTQMLKVHMAPMITEQNCIEDFAVVHWATHKPADDDGLT